jgi:hypothetical protein
MVDAMHHEPPELDPETAERLVGGAAGDLVVEPYLVPLAELIAASAAPFHPDELAGLDAALAAFRQAQARRMPSRRRVVARALSRNALVATFAITALGGGAVAAATGALPTPLTPGDPPSTGSPVTAAPVRPHGVHAGQAAPPAARTTPPQHALIHLCRTFQAGRKASPRHMSALADAAGGRDRVPAFCATLLGTRPGTKATKGKHAPKTDQPTPSATTSKPR